MDSRPGHEGERARDGSDIRTDRTFRGGDHEILKAWRAIPTYINYKFIRKIPLDMTADGGNFVDKHLKLTKKRAGQSKTPPLFIRTPDGVGFQIFNSQRGKIPFGSLSQLFTFFIAIGKCQTPEGLEISGYKIQLKYNSNCFVLLIVSIKIMLTFVRVVITNAKDGLEEESY